jgi:hypothetical protein
VTLFDRACCPCMPMESVLAGTELDSVDEEG